jgi:hypothetical protein
MPHRAVEVHGPARGRELGQVRQDGLGAQAPPARSTESPCAPNANVYIEASKFGCPLPSAATGGFIQPLRLRGAQCELSHSSDPTAPSGGYLVSDFTRYFHELAKRAFKFPSVKRLGARQPPWISRTPGRPHPAFLSFMLRLCWACSSSRAAACHQ